MSQRSPIGTNAKNWNILFYDCFWPSSCGFPDKRVKRNQNVPGESPWQVVNMMRSFWTPQLALYLVGINIVKFYILTSIFFNSLYYIWKSILISLCLSVNQQVNNNHCTMWPTTNTQCHGGYIPCKISYANFTPPSILYQYSTNYEVITCSCCHVMLNQLSHKIYCYFMLLIRGNNLTGKGTIYRPQWEIQQ